MRFVLRGPFGIPLAQLILRTILRDDSIEITRVDPQRDIILSGGRRLGPDICAWSANGRLYGIELQRDSARTDAKRAEGRAAVIRCAEMGPGTEMAKILPITKVYITEHDVYNGGKPVVEMPRLVMPYDPERAVAFGAIINTGVRILYMSIEAAVSPISGNLRTIFCVLNMRMPNSSQSGKYCIHTKRIAK